MSTVRPLFELVEGAADPLTIPPRPRSEPIQPQPGMFRGTFWMWAVAAAAIEVAIGLSARLVLR